MTGNTCGAPIRAHLLGPFHVRLRCTLKPNHEALGIVGHQWVWEARRVEFSTKGHR